MNNPKWNVWEHASLAYNKQFSEPTLSLRFEYLQDALNQALMHTAPIQRSARLYLDAAMALVLLIREQALK